MHGLGRTPPGLTLTESFYWDRDDKSREFGERFFKRTGRMPNMVHAGTYSGVMQYLAIEKAGTDATEPVARRCTSCQWTTSSRATPRSAPTAG